MKFNTLALALAICATAGAAQARTVDWGVHGPVEFGSDAFKTQGSFTDDYLFSLAGNGSLDDVAFAFNVGKMSISDGLISLYSGTPNNATPIGSFHFSGLGGSAGSFDDLALGQYFYTVSGQVTGRHGGSYAFTSSLEPVPEPAPVALALAGIGLMGFIARRRATPA